MLAMTPPLTPPLTGEGDCGWLTLPGEGDCGWLTLIRGGELWVADPGREGD